MILNKKAIKIITEAVHKNDPLLNKNIPRNRIHRQMLAEKLKYLRQARDKNRKNIKYLKANLIDNVARNLTRTPSTDPTMKKLITTPLKELNDKSNLLTYLPQKVTIPWERFNVLKEKYQRELQKGRQYPNKITNYLSIEDINKEQKAFKQMFDRRNLNDNVFEMMKHLPRLTSVIREPNPLLNYNRSDRLVKYYNLRDIDVVKPEIPK